MAYACTRATALVLVISMRASFGPSSITAIVGRTGPDDFSASAKGAKAFFDCLNANGGVKGRPVRYLVMDDQWNPEVSAQLAAKLVNDEKAVAIVGNASFVECGANAATYAKAGVIALIGVGVPRECFNASNIVATNAGPRVSTAAAAQYAAETMGAKNFVCVAPNIPNVGAWACDGVAAWATSQGGKSTAILIDPGSAVYRVGQNINNSGGVTLNDDATVNQTLTFSNGKLSTGTKLLTIATTSAGATDWAARRCSTDQGGAGASSFPLKS